MQPTPTCHHRRSPSLSLACRLFKYTRGDVVLVRYALHPTLLMHSISASPACCLCTPSPFISRSPTDPSRLWCKRIIGLEGDWVAMPGSNKVEKLPKGTCWVEDNRASSNDQTPACYGPLPLAMLYGRCLWVVSPLSRWGAVQSHLPAGRVVAMGGSATPDGIDWWT